MAMQLGPDSGGPRKRRKPLGIAGAALLMLAVVALLVLRSDWWNWSSARPLLFGVLPIGLWWQVFVSVLASGVMWLLVRFAWPDQLEDQIDELDHARHANDTPDKK